MNLSSDTEASPEPISKVYSEPASPSPMDPNEQARRSEEFHYIEEPLLLPDSDFEEDSFFCSVFFTLLTTAIPTIIYMIFTLIVNLISLHFIGLLNDPFMLDGVGIANSLLTCTAQGLVVCLNNGLISLASQAYGAHNHILVGLYFHRALVLNTLILVILFPILFFSKEAFILFSMPEETATYAQTMVTYIYGGLYAFMLYDTLRSYLIAQGVFIPQLLVQILLTIGHWFWCQLFVVHMGMEVKGIAIAYTLTYVLGMLLLYSYMFIFNPRRKSWLRLRRESFRGVWSLLVVEAQVGSMVYLEWIAWEVLIMFSMSYPAKIMGAQVTFFNFCSIMYYMPCGVAVALNALSGKAFGEGNIKRARQAVWAGIILCLVAILFSELLLFFYIDYIAQFFTRDFVIRRAVDQISFIYMFGIPADFVKTLLGGYIRGIGKEKVGSYAFLVCFYGIGLPIAYILGNALDYEIRGLWVGMSVGLYSTFVANVVIVTRANLRAQGEAIQKRLSLHATEVPE